MTNKSIENEALYWKCFAYLAAHGKRTKSEWNAACFQFRSLGFTDSAVKIIQDECIRYKVAA